MQYIAELYVLGNKDLGIKKHRPFYFHDLRGGAKENYTFYEGETTLPTPGKIRQLDIFYCMYLSFCSAKKGFSEN